MKKIILKSGKYRLFNIIRKEALINIIKQIKIEKRSFFLLSTINEESQSYPKWKADNEVQINKYITLKLINGKTEIFINGEKFRQCKYLLLDIPDKCIIEEIDSIDEAQHYFSKKHESDKSLIEPATEFWGHVSNIQAFVENDYDTRILHSNLAFPLLKKLAEVGDSLAKEKLKEEVFLRIQSQYNNVIIFILEGDYIINWTKEELEALSTTPNLTPEAISLIYQKYPNSIIKDRMRKLLKTSIIENNIKIIYNNYPSLDELFNREELRLISKDIKLKITSFLKLSSTTNDNHLNVIEKAIYLVPYFFEEEEIDKLIDALEFETLNFIYFCKNIDLKTKHKVEEKIKEIIKNAFRESNQDIISHIHPKLFKSTFNDKEIQTILENPNLSFFEVLLLYRLIPSQTVDNLIAKMNDLNMQSDLVINDYKALHSFLTSAESFFVFNDVSFNLSNEKKFAYLQCISIDAVSMIELTMEDVTINYDSSMEIVDIPFNAFPPPSKTTPSMEIMILEYQIMFLERIETKITSIYTIEKKKIPLFFNLSSESVLPKVAIPNTNLDISTKNNSSFTLTKQQLSPLLRYLRAELLDNPFIIKVSFSKEGVTVLGKKDNNESLQILQLPLNELKDPFFSTDFKEEESISFRARELTILQKVLPASTQIKFFVKSECPVRIQTKLPKMDINIYIAPKIDEIND